MRTIAPTPTPTHVAAVVSGNGLGQLVVAMSKQQLAWTWAREQTWECIVNGYIRPDAVVERAGVCFHVLTFLCSCPLHVPA
jgi:hypothetical protein